MKFTWVLAGKVYPVLRVFYGARVYETLPSTFARESVMRFSPPLLISGGAAFGVSLFFSFALTPALLWGRWILWPCYRLSPMKLMNLAVDRHSDPSLSSEMNTDACDNSASP